MLSVDINISSVQAKKDTVVIFSDVHSEHRSRELDLKHLRSLAQWRLDDKAYNFAFKQNKPFLDTIAREYQVISSLLRASAKRAESYVQRDSGADLEKVVDFCAIVMSVVHIPIKAPSTPAFQDFLSSAILWFRSLRNSVYVERFWDSLYAMLTMDLSAQPAIRERILGEVADIGRLTPIPQNLAMVLEQYSEKPYLFGDPRQYLRVAAYIIKQLSLKADIEGIIGKWLFFWIGYLGTAKYKDKNLHKEQFEMKDDIHRGIGYLISLRRIFSGRYGGFLVSFNLLLIKLDHSLGAWHRTKYTLFRKSVFGLIRGFWRRPRIRRRLHIPGAQIPLSKVPSDQFRPQLEVFEGAVLRPSQRSLIITRVQGGLGDIMMMRPGLLELAKRRQSSRVYFATNRAFFPAFSIDDPVTLVDIETTRIDLQSFRRWYNFSDCPATRVEGREFPRIRTNRIDIFARALGVKFGLFSNRTRAYKFSDDVARRAEDLVSEHHRPGTLKIGIQLRSAETYRDVPAIMAIARSLAQQHTVFVIDNAPIVKENGDRFIPVTGEKLPVALALVSMMDYTIGPDSSFFHIAGACRIPGVALFGPTGGKVRTKAYPTIKYLDLKDKMACIPCWRNESSPCGVSGGYESICTNVMTPALVLETVSPILNDISVRER